MEKQIITRKENWPMLLGEFISEFREKKFKVGIADCCFMPASCVRKLTGYDPAKPFRGKVKSKQDADYVLDEYGGIVRLINHCLGFEPHENKYLAQRGDVVVCEINGAEIGGIIDDSGRGVLVFVERQLSSYPIEFVKYVWSY